MSKILYFSAVWCGPCKALAPTMDQLASQGMPVQKIDVDQDNNMSAQYGVRNVPTLIKVDANGVEQGRLVGNQSADMIKEWYGN
tara:strand:- start:53 stop:304 length:252 start_codon:yes stop_codon:yes gene_type:complete